QLGERCNRVTGFGMERVVNLEQDRAVTLHDQRIGGIVLHGLLARSSSMTSHVQARAASSHLEGEHAIVDAPARSRKVCWRSSQLRHSSSSAPRRSTSANPIDLAMALIWSRSSNMPAGRFFGSMLKQARISSLRAAGMRGFTLIGGVILRSSP